MKPENVNDVVRIRQYIIECHNSLDARHSGTSVVKQQDVAAEYGRIVKMIDRLLSTYVNFEEK
jgi:hypothetical protein